MITLVTNRLTLRPFRADDIDAYAAICADPEVMRYLTGQPLPRDEAWRQMAMLVGHWELRGYGMWAAEETASRRLVGRVGLHFPEGWPEPEIGWVLAREFWGRGLAFEAAIAAADFAFDTLRWTRAISLIHPDNLRSIKLAGRLGGRFERAITVRGVDVSLYATSASSLRTARDASASSRTSISRS